MKNSKIPLIAVVGPTASGKTALSVRLAKALSGEIVSADSMQIYKGITIASAAPTAEEKEGIPHYMLEFLEQDKSYSVADYVAEAKRVIEDIYSRDKLPILVGGTGLYVNSLTDGIIFTEQKTDEHLRKELEEQFELFGGENMLEKLAEFDEDSAKKFNPTDKRRIIRAFEIFITTGITKTQQDINSKQNASPFEVTFIGITYKDRKKLYDRINKRVDLMLENGLLDEAKSTLELHSGKGAAQAIGHKELHAYLRNEKSFDEAVEDLKRETRRYAKRQLTWFRKNQNINWIYADETEDVLESGLDIVKKEAKL